MAIALSALCIILWPLSHAAPASWKQDLILALSWISLLVAFGALVATTDVRVQQENGGSDG